MKLDIQRYWLEAETRRNQCLQQGFQVQQKNYAELTNSFKSIREDDEREKATLRSGLDIAEKLIATQKEMIDSQARTISGPMLCQHSDPNQFQQFQQFHQYQPLPRPEFVIDPTSLRQLDDYDYTIGTAIDESREPLLPLSTPAAEFDDQMPRMTEKSIVNAVPAELESSVSPHIDESMKRQAVDDGLKRMKKRKAK